MIMYRFSWSKVVHDMNMCKKREREMILYLQPILKSINLM